MKRNRFLTLFIGLMAVILLAGGCAMRREKEESSEGVSIGAVIEKMDEWPDNSYTREVPVPPYGTVYQSIALEDYYSVWLTDISRTRVKDYMALLREEGFREIGGDENEDSGGALFGRESVYVSIAYSGEEMGIGITFDEGTEGILTW